MLIEFKEYEGECEEGSIILINPFDVCVLKTSDYSGYMPDQTTIFYQNGFLNVPGTIDEVRGRLHNLKLIEFQDKATNKIILINHVKISAVIRSYFSHSKEEWTDISTMNGYTYSVTETFKEVRNKIEGK